MGISSSRKQGVAPPTSLPAYNLTSSTNRAISSLNTLPTSANDGTFIQLPLGNSSAIQIYDTDGSTVLYSVLPSVILASSSWLPFFYVDEVDDVIWVLVISEAATPDTIRLAKLDRTTLAVTAVGTESVNSGDSLFEDSDSFLNSHVERAGKGTGDFTFYCGGYVATISSVDGSFSAAPATATHNGVIRISDQENYVTADGKIVMYSLLSNVSGASPYMRCVVNGLFTELLIPVTDLPLPSYGTVRVYSYDKVVMYPSGYNSSSESNGPRFFMRADFDRWLTDIARSNGFLQ